MDDDSIPQNLTAAGASAGEMVKVGELLWDIIQKNKPIADISNKHVSVIKVGKKRWSDYAEWKETTSSNWRAIEGKSLVGLKVVTVDMRAYFKRSGKYMTL